MHMHARTDVAVTWRCCLALCGKVSQTPHPQWCVNASVLAVLSWTTNEIKPQHCVMLILQMSSSDNVGLHLPVCAAAKRAVPVVPTWPQNRTEARAGPSDTRRDLPAATPRLCHQDGTVSRGNIGARGCRSGRTLVGSVGTWASLRVSHTISTLDSTTVSALFELLFHKGFVNTRPA